MSPNNVDVVTVGESLVLFQSLTNRPLQYETSLMKSLGGAESNVAIVLTRLGKKSRWISRVGEDPHGDYVLATLAGEGVDISQVIRDKEAPTAIYFKDFKGYGDPSVYYYRHNSAASRLHPDDIQEDWFQGAKHLHVTGITPALGESPEEMVRQVMTSAREKGMTISFDPNLRRKLWGEERARRVLLSLIPLCDIFLPGLDEAEFLLGKLPTEEYGKRFIEMGATVVVLKLGEKGAIAFSQNHSVQVSPYKVDHVVDTVGAGDAFAAGFISSVLDSGDFLGSEALLKQALQRANVLGALATQFRGDWEGTPTLGEVNNLLKGEQSLTR